MKKDKFKTSLRIITFIVGVDCLGFPVLHRHRLVYRYININKKF